MSKILEKIIKDTAIEIEDIIQLKKSDFYDERLPKRLNDEFQDPYYFFQYGKTITYLYYLEEHLKKIPDLKTEKPELYLEYQKIAIFLKLLTIPMQRDLFLLDIFSKYILFAIEKNVDLKERIYQLYEGVDFLPTECRVFRNYILRGLIKNNELIGGKEINIDGRLAIPTIANWIKDYINSVGIEQGHTTLQEAKYITGSKNTKLLNPKEKETLFKVIKLYDYILTPTLEAGYNVGLEHDFSDQPTTTKIREASLPQKRTAIKEPEDLLNNFEIVPIPGGLRLIPKAAATEIKTEAAPILPRPAVTAEEALPKGISADLKQKIISFYLGDKVKQAAISAEENKLLSESRGNTLNIKNLFFEAVKTNNFNRVIAGLFILARVDRLADLSSEEETTRQIIKNEVFPKIISEVRKNWPGADLEKMNYNFENDLDNPAYIKLLTKYLLNKSSRGDTNESARLGMQLSSILSSQGHKEFLGMTYFDEQGERFEWMPLKVDNQGNFSI